MDFLMSMRRLVSFSFVLESFDVDLTCMLDSQSPLLLRDHRIKAYIDHVAHLSSSRWSSSSRDSRQLIVSYSL